jgi:uncharacterized membrane protein
MNPIVLGTAHWVHVFLGIFWFGTILYSRLVLFPAYKTLPPDTTAAVRQAMVSGNARRYTYLFSYGTVIMGVIRGAMTGVFAQLDTPYGVTYLAALVVGVAMLAFNFAPGFGHPIFRKLYVGGFPVMLTLMVLMRFGY